MTGQIAESPRRVTSDEVARASGVSRATVSYVLNETPGHRISDETRKRVLEVAERLGHVPNASARSLRSGRSRIVLALIPNIARGYVSDSLLRTLDETLAAEGFVLVLNRYDPSTRTVAQLRGLMDPDVIVALSGMTVPEEEAIRKAGTPFVRVHDLIDHEQAGRLAADYVLSRGHRRFGYLFPSSSPHIAVVAEARWKGFCAGIREHGAPAPTRFDIDIDSPNLDLPLRSFLSAADGVSVVAAHNDVMASFLVEALSLRGLSVPKNMAVIGHDDSPHARIGLTTVGIDAEAYANYVFTTVMRALNAESAPAETPPNFLRVIPRQSA